MFHAVVIYVLLLMSASVFNFILSIALYFGLIFGLVWAIKRIDKLRQERRDQDISTTGTLRYLLDHVEYLTEDMQCMLNETRRTVDRVKRSKQ